MKKIVALFILTAMLFASVCSAASFPITINSVSVENSYLADGRVNGGEAMIEAKFAVPTDSTQTTIVLATEDISEISKETLPYIVYINQIDTPDNGEFEFPVVKDMIRSAAELVDVDGCTLYLKIGASGINGFATYKFSFDDTALYGDANVDNSVNPLDLVCVQRYIAEWNGYNSNTVNLTVLDLDGDGSVNMFDAMVFARHLANWIGYDTLPFVSHD